MRFKSMFSFTFLIVFLFTSCATTGVSINTLKDDDVDFSSYHTFYLLPEPPTDNNPYPTLIKSFPRTVVENAVLKELERRNYKQIKDKDQADMLVAIQFSLKDEERTYTTTNSSYGTSGYNSHRYGHYYRSYYGYQTFATTSTVVEKYRKGNMIIDLIDREQNALIWEAFAQGRGETDMNAIEKKVYKVVEEIFLKHPIVLEQNKG